MGEWPPLRERLQGASGSRGPGRTFRGDVKSANWDGGGDLSARDTTATQGYLLDYSTGSIQAVDIYADGGELKALTVTGALTLDSSGTFKTATSGQRVEINGTGVGSDRIRFFTGAAAEDSEGSIQFDGTASTVLLTIDGPSCGTAGSNKSYITLYADDTLGGSLNLFAVGGTSPSITGSIGGTSAFVVEYNGGTIAFEMPAGSATYPGVSFMLDPDTGLFRDTNNELAVSCGATESIRFDSSGIKQEAWTLPTLLNSWVDYGGGYDLRGYRKDASGVVHIQGLVKNGTAANAIIFTLPAGYLPANSLIFGGYSAAGAADLRVTSTGDVYANAGGSTTWTSITCSFAT